MRASSFRSNRLEVLFEALSQELFANGSLSFSKKRIIVPDEEMKHALFAHLVNTRGIAAGIYVSSVTQFFAESGLPSRWALVFQIEERLHKFVGEVSCRRRLFLSEQIGDLFLLYGLYGEEFLLPWLGKKGWQQTLWKELFPPGGPWILPAEALRAMRKEKVYVLGVSSLPRLYRDFFVRSQASFYELSPCALFWEDLRRAEKLEEHSHPLLASWGKLGREALHYEFEREEGEEYAEVDNSLLGALQKDLLLIEREAPHHPGDSSLQIHSASNRLHELEVLYERVVAVLLEQTLLPSDFLILVPQLETYAPLIQMVWGRGSLEYRILGVPRESSGGCVRGFFHLLKLHEEKFSVEAVMHLWTFPSFCAKWGWKEGDREILEEWVAQAAIRRELKGKVGSWEEGLDRLLWGLCVAGPEEELLEAPVFPCQVLDWTQSALLQKMIEFIDALQELLSLNSRSCRQWLLYVEELFPRFFSLSEDALSFLDRVGELKASLLAEGGVPFESVLPLLEDLACGRERVSSGAKVHVVTFASLEGQYLQPARFIGVLGLNEGVFPRAGLSPPLCEWDNPPFPKNSDRDRYRFLELLTIVQGTFFLSYLRQDPEDHQEMMPSILIEELQQYLPQIPMTVHREHYRERAVSLVSFADTPLPKSVPSTIELRSLLLLARNPIRFYLEEGLGIFLEEDEEKEELFLSPLDKAILRGQGMKRELSHVLLAKEREGRLPPGSFGELACAQVREEVLILQGLLQQWGLEEEKHFSVEFSLSCREPRTSSGGNRMFPPLTIAWKEGREISLVGTLQDVCSQGLFLHAGDRSSDLWKVLPQVVLYQTAFPPQFFLTKSGTCQPWRCSDPLEALRRYIEYYEEAKSVPIPLFPDWIGTILRKGEEDFVALCAAKGSPFAVHDPYLEWWKRREGALRSGVPFSRLQQLARGFLELFDGIL